MVLHDKDIREPLFEFLEESFGRVRILEEKNMNSSRADVLMIMESAICGIEIKSDADTYVRLKRQVADYDKFCDMNYVVVGTSHAYHINEHVPDYWGIITVEEVDSVLDFYVLRKATENPKVKWKYKLSFLWRPELAVLQEHFSMPKYKEKGKDFVITKIIERINSGKIDELLLKQKVSEILFERDYNTVQELLQEYRKGEIQKRIEEETDPEKQIELFMAREQAKRNLKPPKKRKRRIFR